MATTMNVNTEEARLITVHRAIVKFAQPELLHASQAGAVLALIEDTVDLAKLEERLDAKELKAMIFGVVVALAGNNKVELDELAASYSDQLEYAPVDERDQLPDEIAQETISGGPTGGVVAGQGNDPRYIKQTGPQD